MVNRTSKLFMIALVITALLVSAGLNSVHAATSYVFSGSITSDTDFKLHQVGLSAGESVVATLVCTDGTLDPVLTVYDPSNVAVAWDDDSYTPCNSASSSYVSFVAAVGGQYTFRADGFSTSTGPYTLTVTTNGNPGRPVPTGFVLSWMSCSTAVFDAPGGNPVGNNAVWAGQRFYVNPTPVKDASGKSWTEIYVSGSQNAFIPTSCAGL
ncbi:MAG: hypothetical protein U0528_17865 [Anaerolineae bacterium]|nr:hypothetical protein [Anaerolineae bacterium]